MDGVWWIRGVYPLDEPQDEQGLYGAMFLGSIQDVSVVEEVSATDEYDLDEFQDYTMETDELERYTGNAYLLRVEMQDDRDEICKYIRE